mgnify:CR=1 FL=1
MRNILKFHCSETQLSSGKFETNLKIEITGNTIDHERIRTLVEQLMSILYIK